MKQLVPGILFAALWASASAATKFGVQVAHPFILANVRFFIAGGGMLLFAYGINRSANAWPTKVEWQRLTIFALLNTTIYLGAYVLVDGTGIRRYRQLINRNQSIVYFRYVGHLATSALTRH